MLEIIVETFEDAIAAETGGAQRLDLKADYPSGGVTPFLDTIDRVCEAVSIDVMVMVRPRPGDFFYSKDELNDMCKTIARAKKKKRVSGFLLGALNQDNTLNERAIGDFIELAGDKDVHVHLCWEMAPDPEYALERLIELGVKSVRITGGKGLGEKAVDYMEVLRSYQEKFGERIELVLAGGVDALNVAPLIQYTGIANAHTGSGVRTPRSVYGRTDARKVRALKTQFDLAVKKFIK